MHKGDPAAADSAAYVAGLDGWQQRQVAALRAAVLEAAPLQEVIKWGHLVYLSNGPALLLRAEPRRVLFGLWRGQRMAALESRLKPGGQFEMATLTLFEDTPLERATVLALAREAVAMNAALGDPTAVLRKR
ncbi:DUF1801 domain-containing protein [Pseudorhodoferax sp. Leaf267]|uniref:DUF1801 domain-containing protein n=1 Tax=Pseudorhodoferax sp. Leaf267 TaxID=1736316 RepID=UPI0012E1C716|nr:DUF1801 domain-containing protein [Pseudorhodoferax sp. Leaf267]